MSIHRTLTTLIVSSAYMLGCSAEPDDSATAGAGETGALGSGSADATSGGSSTSSGGSSLGAGSGGQNGSAAGGSTENGAGGSMLGAGGGPLGTGGGSGDGTGGASDGSGGGASNAPVKSEGCGKAATSPTGEWVSAQADGREYDIWLPENYDPSRAYPAIVLLHGCGGKNNNVQMQQETGEDAIVIRGEGSSDGCWQESASGADMPYVDAMFADLEANYCVDTSNRFAVGWSSGAWLAGTLSCHRADMFRGITSVAGGEPAEINNCQGPVARMFVNDKADNNNQIAWAEPGRDRMLMTNGCSMDNQPVDPSPCVEYQDCDPGYPVIWCATDGAGHSAQSDWTQPAFWNFFQRLMNE